MTSTLTNTPSTYDSERREIASRFTNSLKGAEQFKIFFDNCFEELGLSSRVDPSTKERIWITVSKEKIQALKEYIITLFCEKVLNVLNQEEFTEIREALMSNGRNKASHQPMNKLQLAYTHNKALIFDSVGNVAESLSKNLKTEIMEAAKSIEASSS